MTVNIEGYSGNIANIDDGYSVNVALTLDSEKAGYVTIASEKDAGNYTGNREVIRIKTSKDYRTRIGLDTTLMSEYFSNTTLNSSLWTAPATTMTVVCAGGFCTLNSGGSVATGTVARLTSYRTFPVIGPYGVNYQMTAKFTSIPILNNVVEWGAGICTASALPTDGAFFRISATGEFRAILNYNGIEVQSDSLDFNALVDVNTMHQFLITITDGDVRYWIDDIIVATIFTQVGSPYCVSSAALPVFVRTYNVTAVSVAQKISIGQISVTIADINAGKQMGHTASSDGSMLYQNPSNYGTTIGQTARYGYSANPAAGTPSITAANLGSGLGGVFIANIGGTSLSTDKGYIISSYQIPTMTKNIPGMTLYITGIKFNAKNEVVANGVGPLTYEVIAAYGATQVDGYNGGVPESNIAKVARLVNLGVQSFPAAAIVGADASPEINVNFKEGPIVVNQGEFIQILIKFITFTDTNTQALWCYVTFTGYWE
jgi:hypothetical protein